MITADELRSIADRLDVMVRNQDFEAAVDLSAETLPRQIASVLKTIVKYRLYVQIPRNRMLYLYLGNSDSLERYKVGITNNVARRTKDINASLTHLAMTADFEVVHYGFAPEAVVRRAERQLLNDLKPYSVGGEWFRHDDHVFCTIFDTADLLWDEYYHYIENFDITPDIRACSPGRQLYVTQEMRVRQLDLLTKLSLAWLKTHQEVMDILENRIERARLHEVAQQRASLFGDWEP